MGLRDKAKAAHDEKHDEEADQSVKVQRTTSDTPGHQEPRAERSNNVDSVLDKRQ